MRYAQGGGLTDAEIAPAVRQSALAIFPMAAAGNDAGFRVSLKLNGGQAKVAPQAFRAALGSAVSVVLSQATVGHDA